MRDACVESPINSVWCDPAYNTFVGTESAAFPGVGSDLHAILLDYAMYSLLVDLYALLSKFAP